MSGTECFRRVARNRQFPTGAGGEIPARAAGGLSVIVDLRRGPSATAWYLRKTPGRRVVPRRSPVGDRSFLAGRSKCAAHDKRLRSRMAARPKRAAPDGSLRPVSSPKRPTAPYLRHPGCPACPLRPAGSPASLNLSAMLGGRPVPSAKAQSRAPRGSGRIQRSPGGSSRRAPARPRRRSPRSS